TVNQAAENHALQPFDVELLKVLFLIRYIDELPGNVDNLVTLCIRNIDADRLGLRKQIEASLARLESETLIARNGDLYLFLTNEERDIGREIKNTTIPSGSEARELGKIIFEDLLGDTRKHTYGLTGRDFGFNRQCDDHYVGHQQDGTMEVAVVSPLGDRFADFESDEATRSFTIGHGDTVIIRLPDDDTLARELRSYIQTETYIKGKHGGGGNESTTRILKDQADSNRTRRKRLGVTLKDLLEQAAYFASGERLDQGSTNPKDALGRAMESLIKNTYPKMGYLEHLSTQPKQELQSILRANDVDQAMLGLPTTESNKQALDDLREYVRLSHQAHHEIILEDLVEKRYGGRPYGWPELETLLLVARLVVLQEIELQAEGQVLPPEQAYDKLVKSTERRRIRVAPKAKVDDAVVRKAQSLGLTLFAEQGPDGDEKLYGFCRTHLDDWHQRLRSYGPFAQSGKYPGHEDIDRGLGVLRPLVGEDDPVRFLDRFVGASDDLKDLGEDLQDLRGFYENQKPAWDRMLDDLERFESNQVQLEADDRAGSALARLREIVKSPRPYAQIAETGSLVETVRSVNDGLIAAARPGVLAAITASRSIVQAELEGSEIDAGQRSEMLARFEALAADVEAQSSIAHIEQARTRADREVETAMQKIAAARKAGKPGDDGTPPKPTPTLQSISPREIAGEQLILSNKDDVDSYLDKLRKALETAIQQGRR
ncbi:MAG: BREX system P-loop protein BrxC, partial [Phycisphaera sp.]|nr:BREX system P-loop protein BrxC [Phycisphaera sp.]